ECLDQANEILKQLPQDPDQNSVLDILKSVKRQLKDGIRMSGVRIYIVDPSSPFTTQVRVKAIIDQIEVQAGFFSLLVGDFNISRKSFIREMDLSQDAGNVV